jgi:hypothetical protein
MQSFNVNLEVLVVALGSKTVSCQKKVKVKAVPLQVWTGPEGSRRLRLPDFKTIGTRRW